MKVQEFHLSIYHAMGVSQESPTARGLDSWNVEVSKQSLEYNVPLQVRTRLFFCDLEVVGEHFVATNRMHLKFLWSNFALYSAMGLSKNELFLLYLIDVTFVPFGPNAGDNETALTSEDVTLLGPLSLDTPLVFYLQNHHQLYVSEYIVGT